MRWKICKSCELEYPHHKMSCDCREYRLPTVEEYFHKCYYGDTMEFAKQFAQMYIDDIKNDVYAPLVKQMCDEDIHPCTPEHIQHLIDAPFKGYIL